MDTALVRSPDYRQLVKRLRIARVTRFSLNVKSRVSVGRTNRMVLHAQYGNWLRIAENELSSITRQWISGRRIGSIEELQNAIHLP